jgi:hypothetical protein
MLPLGILPVNIDAIPTGKHQETARGDATKAALTIEEMLGRMFQNSPAQTAVRPSHERVTVICGCQP